MQIQRLQHQFLDVMDCEMVAGCLFHTTELVVTILQAQRQWHLVTKLVSATEVHLLFACLPFSWMSALIKVGIFIK